MKNRQNDVAAKERSRRRGAIDAEAAAGPVVSLKRAPLSLAW